MRQRRFPTPTHPAFGKLRIRDVTRARIEAYVAQQHAAFLKGGRSTTIWGIAQVCVPLCLVAAKRDVKGVQYARKR